VRKRDETAGAMCTTVGSSFYARVRGREGMSVVLAYPAAIAIVGTIFATSSPSAPSSPFPAAAARAATCSRCWRRFASDSASPMIDLSVARRCCVVGGKSDVSMRLAMQAKGLPGRELESSGQVGSSKLLLRACVLAW